MKQQRRKDSGITKTLGAGHDFNGHSRFPTAPYEAAPAARACGLRLSRLDRGSDLPLTLISAPAGYGKSLLVSHWVESRPEPCVWLSLDDSDTEFEVFLEYLVAAIEKVLPNVCPQTRGLIRSTTAAPLAIFTKTLINELDALRDDSRTTSLFSHEGGG